MPSLETMLNALEAIMNGPKLADGHISQRRARQAVRIKRRIRKMGRAYLVDPCPDCGTLGAYELDGYCGAWVCSECGNHWGLARCYCGWSRSGGDGRRELIEMGERIDPYEF